MTSYDEWQRTHRRSLLVLPITAAKSFLLPVAIAMVGIGAQQPKILLVAGPLAVVGSIGLGWVVWATTRYRIADGAFVVQRGVLNRTSLTAPVDRIRSVDLEASLLHRVLGLEKVAVGTGVDDTRIELNSLSTEEAEQLRTLLLGMAHVAESPADTEMSHSGLEHEATAAAVDPPQVPAGAATSAPEQVLATLDPKWSRFAPFSLVRLAVVGAALGALTQFDLPVIETGAALWDKLIELSVMVVVVGLVVGALAAWTALSVVGYLVQWWDLRLFREGGNLRLTRGLLTTSSTTVEVARIRGVEVTEPVLLRMVNGAEATALVTGLESGKYAVLPQVPRAVATSVAGQVLWLGEEPGTVDPLAVPLVRHGAAATRRCHIRGQLAWTGWVLPLALLAIVFDVAPTALAVGAVSVAVLLGLLDGFFASRHLGHALTDDHLVVGSGQLTRTRTVLERAGIIGWVLSQNPFQRRHDLVTLIATTAAGAEHVTVRDIPRSLAEPIVTTVTPS